ncbi:MAG: phosphoadenylyl-sulfate reductase [Geminicoccaceae bacterium]
MDEFPSVGDLQRRCDDLEGVELLMVLAGPGGAVHGRTAMVSSFGAESAVLLHLVASVDPYIPVIFLDTLKHFPETLEHRDRLIERLGLREVRTLRPDRLSLAQNDRHERLFLDDPDLCCHIRKAEPLDVALRSFSAWITGRKRYQGGTRAQLDTIERDPATGRLKLNPLAGWSEERIEAYRREYGLPLHPLTSQGYRSIGCAPCTRPTRSGEDSRAGRWTGLDKIECGIHRPATGSSADREAVAARPWPMLAGIGEHRGPGLRRSVLAGLLDRLMPGVDDARDLPLDVVVPDPDLRELLLEDPSLAALLEGFRGVLAWNPAAPALAVHPNGQIGLLPALRQDPQSLVAAARFGIELTEIWQVAAQNRAARTAAALRYMRRLPGARAPVLMASLPPALAALLAEAEEDEDFDTKAVQVLSPLLDGADECDTSEAPASSQTSTIALSVPLELALAEAGDTRLLIDPHRGLNRYGTAPRPRPEAIHFSSSTASSVSDYGFLLCDEIRRQLLRQHADAGAWGELADRIRGEIAKLFGLAPNDADVALAASGTDTELLAVLVALAASPTQRLTNILVAPEESGRGVALAGAGRFFDDLTAAGCDVRAGQPAWPDRVVETRCLPIRDLKGRVRSTESIVADLREEVARSLAAGDRVLVHVLLGSKTGISAPPLEVVDALRRGHERDVDVVVDACQLRVTPSLLGALARRGWMVQITGSKFLTGPAFSGALIVPAAMRARSADASALLAAAPAVGRAEDWPAAWRMGDDRPARLPDSYGLLYRWIAALGEAALLGALPRSLCKHAFQRFRTALHERLEASPVLVPMPTPDRHLADLGEEAPGLAARSIICFSPTVEDAGGARRRASLEECQLLFECLNSDVSARLRGLDETEMGLARRAMHIGQPVALRTDGGEAPVVLRLVVGARFFTIVGYPADGDHESALQAEIGDAVAAIAKMELLVRHLPELKWQT